MSGPLAAGALGLALLAAVAAGPAGAAARPDFRGVEEAAGEAVASGDVPGVVVLVGRDHEVLLHRAWGHRARRPRPAPMTADTVFDIASLTKPLGTTLAVLALVERGAVALDAPLGRYLREFDGRPFRDVTVRRLLAHTAGFPAIPPNRVVAVGFPAAARALAERPLDYPPGTAFQYSDTGFMLLGEVVRRVSGEPLDRYLARVLFRPLGLRDTTFRPPASLRPRIAPTQFHNGTLLQGEVHDPRARLLGGVAGHAGLFSTAADLARICRLLLNGGELDGVRILRPATVRALWEPVGEAEGRRSLGWDITSGYAWTMAPFFPPGAVGHLGYTGTAVWLDPPTRTYLILLTNRVHPDGGGQERIRELRLRVAAEVGAALFAPSLARSPAVGGPASDGAEPAAAGPRPARPGPGAAVQTGLDVLVARDFAPLRGQTVGLVTNHTGLDRRGRRAIDLLAAAPGVQLAAVFSPEHGLGGEADSDVPHGRDPATGRPVWSLYGPTRRPTAEMLRGLGAVVFDVQDVGVRYYTYLTTLLYVMEEAGRRGVAVVVLDRPNPITGRVVEGPVMDPDLTSFTAPHPVPVRTGLTIGEFARLAAGERRLPVRLTVVAMQGWRRDLWYDETGLPWTNPSPNIRSVTQALLYAGVGLVEGTNLSVGRGTDTPFEVVGAPWVDGAGLAQALNRRGLAGVRFEPVEFTPAADRHAGEPCRGVRLVVTDREALRPVTVALTLAAELRARHREQFRPEKMQHLLVHRPTMWAFLRGEPVDRVLAWGEMDRGGFLNRRASYLIY